MRKVHFILDALTHYRAPFFENLLPMLQQHGVGVRVFCGCQKNPDHIDGNIPWAESKLLRRFGRFTFLPGAVSKTKEADMVIVSQVVRQLHLYPLMARQLLGHQKLALWGHGKVFGAGGNPAERLVKMWISKRVHWWFAYNNRSRKVVEEEIGFPQDRITNVMNAIDTTAMRTRLADLGQEESRHTRESLGIRGTNVGLHVSGMTSNKRVPFLLEAAALIRREITDFELVIIGPRTHDAKFVEEAAARFPWVHFVGPKTALEAVPFWAMSRLLLYPGMVGLVAVDSFAMGVPLLTTDVPDHSVEIDYVENGRNGIIISPWNDAQNYAREVIALFRNQEKLEALRQGALADASTYSIEKMAENFAKGILEALQCAPQKLVAKIKKET